MRTSLGQNQPSKRPTRQSNGVEYVQGPTYDDNEDEQDEDEEMDEDEDYGSDEDEFCQQRMPEQHPAIRTTVQLMELMDGDRPYLDLNPHYQRNVVWTRKAKKMLIDSMFEGFFVPPVIFNVTQFIGEHGAARYKRTCVDGKQRLTSIRDFMRGRFPWSIGNKDWYYTTPTNDDGTRKGNVSLKRVLPDSQKQSFGKKAIVCVEYKDLSQQQEIELFQRVQLGKPLTKAETFRASQGSWQDLAKTFESDYAEVINLCRQNNRASGFWLVLQCFSQIFECIDPSGQDGVPRIRNRVPNIERLCSDSASLTKTTKNHLRSIFDRLLAIVREDASVFESAHYTKAKTFGPIELIAVCSMIARWGDSRPNGLYRGDIRGLRDRLREIYGGELRGSNDCWTICWRYIEDLDIIRGTVDGSTTAKGSHASGNWGDSAVAVRPGPPGNKTTAPTAPNIGGRRRSSGEGDGDYRPTNSARKTGPAQRKQPKATQTSKNATPPVRSRAMSPKPFAAHLPVYNREDDSSSSSSDDEAPNGGGAPIVIAAPTAVATAPAAQSSSARKRAIMELGTGNNAALDLEAKKAKLMAGRIKQEKEP